MPPISIDENFKGYISSKSVKAIPYNFLTKNTKNIYLNNGMIRKRKPFTDITGGTVNISLVDPVEVIDGTSRYIHFKIDDDGQITYATLKKTTTELDTLVLSTVEGVAPTADRMDVAKVGKLLYITDSSDLYAKVKGENFVRQGIVKGLLSSVPIFTGTWALALGKYDYVISYVIKDSYEEIEGNISGSLTANITSTSQKVTVIPIVDNRYTHYRIYRRFQTTGGPFFRIGETTMGSNFDDTGITENVQLPGPTRNTQLTSSNRRCARIAFWRRRLWMSIKGGIARIYFSLLNQPDYMPEDLFFNAGDDDETIMRLIPTENLLVIFKEHSVWGIFGDNINNFRLKRMLLKGTSQPWATIKGKDRRMFYFINEQGIWEWDISSNPVNIGIGFVEADFRAVPETAEWFAQVDPKTGYIWFGVYNDVTKPILVYNPAIKQFVGKFYTETPVVGISNIGRNDNALSLLIMDENTTISSKLWGYDYAGNPAGTPETSFDVVAAIGGNTGESRGRQKLFRMMQVFDDASATTESVDIKYVKNEDAPATLSSVILGDTGQKFVNIGKGGRSMGFQFEKTASSVSADWIIQGLDIEFETIGLW